jgi:DNA polymerase alpha subunit A
VNIEDTTPPDALPCTVHSFVRPLDRFPPHFESTARASGRGVLAPQRNERMLLQSLLRACAGACPLRGRRLTGA